MKKIAVMIETSRAYGRALMEGIAAFAQEAGDWKLRSLPNERITAEQLKEYDGLILRLADAETAREITRAHLPAIDVYGDRPQTTPIFQGSNGVCPQIPIADGNHEKIGEMAANFFIKRGFRNFAWCGIDGLAFSDRRGDAFCREIAAEGFDPLRYRRPRRIRADSSLFYDERLDRIPDAAELARWLGSVPKPTAVFCCHDYRAYQLMLVASDLKIRIPEELSILGVDNDTTLCAFAPVPLSSIDPNAFKVGHSAARMLQAILTDPPRDKVHRAHAVNPSGIVERESTEFIPTDPPWLSQALLFIEKNYPRGISAADVIRLVGKSSTYVERIFKQKTALSVQAYITRVRMAEAERLLTTTDMMIKEISYRCGYSSVQYFCRVFAELHGRRPLSLRHQTTGDSPQNRPMQTVSAGVTSGNACKISAGDRSNTGHRR